MACLTQGTTNNCATPISGGAFALYIVEASDIAGYVFGLDGIISGLQ